MIDALKTLASRGIMGIASRFDVDSRLSVLIFHRVLSEPDSLFPGEADAKTFDKLMALVAASFRIIPLCDAIRGLRNGNLPRRAACITFDDGYADNAEVALPILQKHGISAAFFVATGFLDGGRMWNDTVIELVRAAHGPILDLSAMGFGTIDIATNEKRQQAINILLTKLKYLPLESRQAQIDRICSLVGITLPTDLMMSSEQVRKLHSAGMEIGGHTVHHPILTRLAYTDARSEIANGKDALENITRAPVRLFAYPNGKPNQDYASEHVQMVKDLGFEGAVSTAWGAAKTSDDLFQLPRFTPWDRGQVRFTLRMVQNMSREAQIV
jgi:peptidoglycan/xylan/chitin deacetylase (PgdA/CDA1 family)